MWNTNILPTLYVLSLQLIHNIVFHDNISAKKRGLGWRFEIVKWKTKD